MGTGAFQGLLQHGTKRYHETLYEVPAKGSWKFNPPSQGPSISERASRNGGHRNILEKWLHLSKEGTRAHWADALSSGPPLPLHPNSTAEGTEQRRGKESTPCLLTLTLLQDSDSKRHRRGRELVNE